MIDLKIIDTQNPYNELAYDYWLLKDTGEFIFSIKQLQTKYNLTQNQITKIIQDLASAYSTEIICSTCSTQYIYTSRSDFSLQKAFQKREWTCDTCIKKAAQIIINKKNDFLLEQKTREKRNISDLSITELIYLITLIKHNACPDGITIDRVTVTNAYLLTPYQELNFELLRCMNRNNICIISDKTSLSNI